MKIMEMEVEMGTEVAEIIRVPVPGWQQEAANVPTRTDAMGLATDASRKINRLLVPVGGMRANAPTPVSVAAIPQIASKLRVVAAVSMSVKPRMIASKAAAKTSRNARDATTPIVPLMVVVATE